MDKLTPWFDPVRDGLPIRTGLYNVANKAVVAISKEREPYGWVKQWWDATKKNWQPWQPYGFYRNDSVGAWQGVQK